MQLLFAREAASVAFSEKGVPEGHPTVGAFHMDLCGPMQHTSLGGSEYFMLVVDDFSRLTWVFFLKHKSEAFLSLKDWIVLVENESGNSVKTIRADKGGEFTSREFQRFCASKDIKREFANTGTPSENVL